MGAKKLKAIAVAGSHRVDLADPDMFKSVREEILKHLRNSKGAKRLSEYGTGPHLDAYLETGNLPLKNWAGDQWDMESALAISAAEVSKDSFKRTKSGCYGCPIGCEKVVSVSDGPYATEEGRGPEYETLGAFGSLLLNDNWESIVRANDLCNRYGMDTIEAGTTIAMAMECFEQGILSEGEVGMSLYWGDSDAIVKAVGMMALREGFGNVLAEGVRKAAEEIGRGAPEFAMHVKGSSLGMHDPRIRREMGLKYVTLSMGAYHGKGCPMEGSVPPDAVEMAKTVVARQNVAEVTDSLIMCDFAFAAFAGGISREQVPKLLLAVTGHEWNLDELDLIGERIVNIKRVFVTHLGVTKEDDKLPKRFKEIPRVRYETEHTAAIVDNALPEYYRLRGWTDDGKPTKERLRELGIDALQR